MIYEYINTMTVAGGSNNVQTFSITGGLARYLLIRANSNNTIFRADLKDKNLITRLNYDFHEGEIVDDKLTVPMTGRYTIDITNASTDDTFRVILSVQEV